jgi:hypothetical protein
LHVRNVLKSREKTRRRARPSPCESEPRYEYEL